MVFLVAQPAHHGYRPVRGFVLPHASYVAGLDIGGQVRGPLQAVPPRTGVKNGRPVHRVLPVGLVRVLLALQDGPGFLVDLDMVCQLALTGSQLGVFKVLFRVRLLPLIAASAIGEERIVREAVRR